MQKSEDNSRTGFELAKQQLKLHIAHQKLKKSCHTQSIRGETISDLKMDDCDENVITERESQIAHVLNLKRHKQTFWEAVRWVHKQM